MEARALVEVRNLTKYFYGKKRAFSKEELPTLRAVDGVDLTIMPGKTLGLVGESGCGKSTLGRAIIKLHEPTSGQIVFDGEDITSYSVRQMKPLRQKMQMIFQDPFTSLNPRKTNFDSVASALDSVPISPQEKRNRIAQMMEYVGVAREHYFKYPHELSGGQRQRVIIARAMVSNPSFIVCDEPVSALDVSVRSQVLNLMRDIQDEKGISYLFISHDMSVIRFLCDRIAVMSLGRVVEEADRTILFSEPVHPYTKALMSAIPVPDVDVAKSRERIVLQGELPSPWEKTTGCRFAGRCRYATDRCRAEEPELKEIAPGHRAACHLV